MLRDLSSTVDSVFLVILIASFTLLFNPTEIQA